jgi:hypothetical protein
MSLLPLSRVLGLRLFPVRPLFLISERRLAHAGVVVTVTAGFPDLGPALTPSGSRILAPAFHSGIGFGLAKPSVSLITSSCVIGPTFHIFVLFYCPLSPLLVDL